MKRVLTSILLIMILLPLGLVGSFAQSKLPLTEFTLPNGLRVIVLEDRRAPVVLHMIAYDVGGADEIAGKTGLAHFLEHLLFRGTTKFPAGVFDQLMDDNGVERNAFTTHDITAYYERGAKELLPLFIELEADRMKNLKLDAAIFEVERKVVLEERRQRVEGSPMGAPMEKLDAMLYAPHPYGRPVIGTPEDIASVTVDDVIQFYRAHYQPDAATVVIVGDVSPSDVRVIVEKHYGALTNDGAKVVRPKREAPRAVSAQRLDAADPRLGAPVMVRKYLGPAIGTSTPKERAALAVLTMVLSGHPQSRLELDLVQRRGIATWAASNYQSVADALGQFTIYGSPAPGTDLNALEAEIDTILAGLAEGKLSEDDLKLPKEMARASFIYSLDDLAGVGTGLGVGLVMGAELEDLLQRDALIETVTVEDVVAAARRIFKDAPSATLHMSKP
jgi:zinc protease